MQSRGMLNSKQLCPKKSGTAPILEEDRGLSDKAMSVAGEPTGTEGNVGADLLYPIYTRLHSSARFSSRFGVARRQHSLRAFFLRQDLRADLLILPN